MIYFDHNATSPLHPSARDAWLAANDQFIANPSSPHRLGSRADRALTEARERLARFLGCAPTDLVWTSGATESNNLALHHLAGLLPVDAVLWVSAIEHPSMLEPARHYFERRIELIRVTRSGVVDVDWLQATLRRRRPGAIAVMAANNETGVLQPWRAIHALCREHGIHFVCDGTQWIGRLPVASLGAGDFVSGSAHKFGGPKGVGFLKCPARGRVEPLLRGGPQEEGRRAGTENVAGVLAMLAALEVREETLRHAPSVGRGGEAAPPAQPPAPAAGLAFENPSSSSFSPFASKPSVALETRLGWRESFEQGMLRALPGAAIIGAGSDRLWNTVSALMPEAPGPSRWVVKLDKAGFAVSTGSACSSGQEKPSHVLAALGYAPAESSRVLRFSSGWETTEAEWQGLLETLRRIGAEGKPRPARQASPAAR